MGPFQALVSKCNLKFNINLYSVAFIFLFGDIIGIFDMIETQIEYIVILYLSSSNYFFEEHIVDNENYATGTVCSSSWFIL